ncbi:MAG TPA: tripartite tricarboxylate transporter substrate binding protein [Xanthobacteraceae bacterium]|nr:tripartite tricarboxylate transporter substrate binding protein [Xanthobacteraceae bacterium]
MQMRKLARLTIVAVMITAAATLALAQARYPSRTIEIVVAYGPGGSTDLVARALAQKFQDRLGQSVVVLNKPGGSGTIGASVAARAAPDGYTLYVGYTSETVVVPQLSKGVKYSIDDFEPIAVTGLVPLVLIASKNIRAANLHELIEELRAAPGKFTYGGGIASPPHVMGAWFNRLNNLTVTHVPYRGGGQAVADVIGGHIDMFYAGLAAAKGAIDSGAVKAFAVTGDVRSPALPNVPTFKEAGVKDFDLASWNVLLAPKGTPADVLALLRRETALALDDPKVRELYIAQGVEVSPSQDVKAFLAKERDNFGRVVRSLGITME